MHQNGGPVSARMVAQYGPEYSEGQNKECLIVETTFIFEGKEYTPIFLVLDATEAISQVQKETEVQIHGILGTPFFIENKWIIDFDKLTLRTIDTE